MSDPVSRVAVIGLGLIGGSLCRALRESGFCSVVSGYDQDADIASRALQLGIVTEAHTSLESAAQGADIVVLAVPVLALDRVLSELAPLLAERVVLTDVGSVKRGLLDAAGRLLSAQQRGWLVPGHPIAGSERSGVDAADASLFRDHRVIITPPDGCEPQAIALVEAMWHSTGAQVERMSPDHHDEVLAITSHLPHMLAYALVDALAGLDESREIFRYAAGGFRDFTRIASSDPLMWHDIFAANRDQVLAAIELFERHLDDLKLRVREGDGTALLGTLTRARSAREHFLRMQEGMRWMDTQTAAPDTLIAGAGGKLLGAIRVPGDKSISHRSIMLAALADGVTEVEGFLEGEDSLATLQAFRDMGVVIEGPAHGRVVVHGVGMDGLKAPHGPLYCGNSGTSMRLLAGLLAAQNFDSELTGDASLSKRPMRRVTDPLARMGAQIDSNDGGMPPLRISGGQSLAGIRYEMPMASAQVKSCLLLAGLRASGETEVVEPAPTRDHSERMLQGFGYPVERRGNSVRLAGGGRLTACRVEVPGDISSAAFFLVAASIAPGSELTIEHVGINPTRTGVIDILRLMGADIELLNQRESGGEPVADLRVRSADLKGIEIPVELVPLAIDEFPVVFVAAAIASGTTILRGAEELRVKESDRIQVMADGLCALGVDAEALPDGMRIVGGPLGGGEIESHGDHRIAMAFAVAGLRSMEPIRINDCRNVATSFPGFVDLATGCGMRIETED